MCALRAYDNGLVRRGTSVFVAVKNMNQGNEDLRLTRSIVTELIHQYELESVLQDRSLSTDGR